MLRHRPTGGVAGRGTLEQDSKPWCVRELGGGGVGGGCKGHELREGLWVGWHYVDINSSSTRTSQGSAQPRPLPTGTHL